jgi:two-component SAPR family response regulator
MVRVVAIDDDASILRLVQLVLEREGYAVQPFLSPLEALEHLKNEAPDVIVCDMRMPGLSGLELLTEIRKTPTLTAVPFLFLSSYAEKADVRAGMLFGADDYLGKPFSPKELVEAIKVRLERYQELRVPAKPLTPPPGLQVRAMGAPQVVWQGTPAVWSSRKAAELFFYLLEKGSASSWEVAEALWPDKDEERASSLFHTTLHRLRKSLFSEVVDSANRRYSLQYDLEVQYDVRDFRIRSSQALKSRDLNALEGSIALFGPFLSDFDSEWCSEMATSLCQIQVNQLECAAGLLQAQGRLRESQNLLEKAVQLDPLADSLWRQLEGVLTQLGDARAQAAALRQPWWAS